MILMLSPQSYRWRRFSPGRESLWWWYQTMVLNMLARNLRGFSKSWNFHHYTSSPHHPKGNGTAEAALKQAKRILKMSHDPWMAILEQRNTPDELASPNEKLNSRRTRTVIPVKSELLEPHVIPTSSIIRASVKKKQQNKRYHDKRAKPLPPLVVGDNIRAKIRPRSSPLWTQGSMVRRESDRSYTVRADGCEYRRNRCHIRKTREMTTFKAVVTDPSLDSPVGSPKILRSTWSQQWNRTNAVEWHKKYRSDKA